MRCIKNIVLQKLYESTWSKHLKCVLIKLLFSLTGERIRENILCALGRIFFNYFVLLSLGGFAKVKLGVHHLTGEKVSQIFVNIQKIINESGCLK